MMAQRTSELTDTDPGTVWSAWVAAITANDVTQLEAIYGNVAGISEEFAVLKKMDSHGLYQWAEAFEVHQGLP